MIKPSNLFFASIIAETANDLIDLIARSSFPLAKRKINSYNRLF